MAEKIRDKLWIIAFTVVFSGICSWAWSKFDERDDKIDNAASIEYVNSENLKFPYSPLTY